MLIIKNVNVIVINISDVIILMFILLLLWQLLIWPYVWIQGNRETKSNLLTRH